MTASRFSFLVIRVNAERAESISSRLSLVNQRRLAVASSGDISKRAGCLLSPPLCCRQLNAVPRATAAAARVTRERVWRNVSRLDVPYVRRCSLRDAPDAARRPRPDRIAACLAASLSMRRHVRRIHTRQFRLRGSALRLAILWHSDSARISASPGSAYRRSIEPVNRP